MPHKHLHDAEYWFIVSGEVTNLAIHSRSFPRLLWAMLTGVRRHRRIATGRLPLSDLDIVDEAPSGHIHDRDPLTEARKVTH